MNKRTSILNQTSCVVNDRTSCGNENNFILNVRFCFGSKLTRCCDRGNFISNVAAAKVLKLFL
ncbi:hypothetical protein [Nostoc sp.]|uniref:hypothetical protein n=1 Tax=Nostoc sp. TaxID=1180 RepID=UPI002FF5F59C